MAIPRVPKFGSEVLPTSKLSALGDAVTYAINPTACGVALNAATNVTSGATPLVTWDTEDFDPSNQIAVPNTTITVAEAGFYLPAFFIEWSSNATGYRLAQLELNGTTITGDSKPAANGIPTKCTASIGKLLVAGDQIAVRVLQNSGSTLTITGRLSIARVSGT